MIILLCLLFVATSLIAVLYNRRKLAVYCLTSILVVLVLVVWGPLTYIALCGLQKAPPLSSPQWKSDNLIVVLGFGVVRWQEKVVTSTLGAPRVLEAARLYFDCKKTTSRCRLLATGGDPQKHGMAEAEAMAHDLEGLGIPSLDILTETKSRNTFENARFTRELLGKTSPEQIVLVTSGPHMRRSMLYFSHFFSNIVAAPADFFEVRMTGRPYPQNILYVDFALHEYAGMILYRVYNVLGLNPAQESLNAR